jgi:hypothetical protein
MQGICLAIEKGRGGEVYFITNDGISTFKSFLQPCLNPGNVSKNVIRTVAAVLNFWYQLPGIKLMPIVI